MNQTRFISIIFSINGKTDVIITRPSGQTKRYKDISQDSYRRLVSFVKTNEIRVFSWTASVGELRGK